MIGYALFVYIGCRMGAPWWYYFLIGLAVCIKTFGAIAKAAKSVKD